MSKQTRTELQQFAMRIEKRITAAGQRGTENIENLVCRLLSGQDPKVAAVLAQKWVEWRYGKATEHVKIEGTIEHTVFTPERLAQLSDTELAEVDRIAEKLIESAISASNPG